MNGHLRTTVIVVGPFTKPLAPDVVSLVANFVAKAIGRGYACARLETETSVSVTAVQSAPPDRRT